MKRIGDVLKENKWQQAPAPFRVASDGLNCKPECECGGIGFFSYDVPRDHILFGAIFPCPNLPPENLYWRGRGLSPKELHTLTWESLEIRENIAGAIARLKTEITRGKGLGYLYGGPGLAKTRLLKVACAEWKRGGKGSYLFTTQKAILDDLRAAYDDDEPQRAIRDLQNKFSRIPLLCIDEITIERNTEFKIEEFFDLINRRHEAGVEDEGKFLTIMAANISPAEIDFRIRDRLTDPRCFVYKLTGESYRPAMHWSEDENSNLT